MYPRAAAHTSAATNTPPPPRLKFNTHWERMRVKNMSMSSYYRVTTSRHRWKKTSYFSKKAVETNIRMNRGVGVGGLEMGKGERLQIRQRTRWSWGRGGVALGSPIPTVHQILSAWETALAWSTASPKQHQVSIVMGREAESPDTACPPGRDRWVLT